MLALDLFVLHREERVVRFREAVLTSLGWIALAGLFAVGVYFWMGSDRALEFTTGYLVEESLSVDNLFVFLLIFRYFQVPAAYQHKVLFWGILGALVTRGIFILAGVSLIQRFHWIVYAFGALLVYSGAKLAFGSKQDENFEKKWAVQLFRRWFPVTPDYVNGHFLVRRERWDATPLLLVLLVVESTDVIFAVDSIPAVLAITRDPFIVYTSNVFAILGLRSLYFALAGMMERFAYLHYGLSLILVFVGAKMILAEFYPIPVGIALGVIVGVLAISAALSLLFAAKRAVQREME
jgi:tellurite resistance protein TerC